MSRIIDYLSRLKANLSNSDLFLIWDTDLNRTAVASYGNLKSSLSMIELVGTKPFGENGGVAVVDTWTPRELTSLVYDDTLTVSLSSNQFTLSTGTYQINVSSAFTNTGNTRLRLYDVTNSIPLLYSFSKVITNENLQLQGRLIVTDPITVRLEYRCSTNSSSGDLGQAVSTDTDKLELYTQIQLIKK